MISTLGLIVSSLIALTLVCLACSWFPRFVVYLQRDSTLSEGIANLIASMERVERAVDNAVHGRSDWAGNLSEDLQRRSVEALERLRR